MCFESAIGAINAPTLNCIIRAWFVKLSTTCHPEVGALTQLGDPLGLGPQQQVSLVEVVGDEIKYKTRQLPESADDDCVMMGDRKSKWNARRHRQ